MRFVAAAVLPLAALLACVPSEPLPQRFDLWVHLPQQVNRGSVPEGDRRTFYSGFGRRFVRALLHHDDERLHWTIPLGSDRRLAFRPLVEEGTCTFVVAAGPRRGAGTEQFRATYRGPTRRLPERVEVSLPAEPERLHVGLVVSGEGCRAAWGSATIYHRAGRRESPTEESPEPSAERPNIVLVGLDTFRADALGAYGREPSVTPALDALAARSDLYLDAYATANSTNPSFVSLMTGLYTKNHGVADLMTPLPDSYETLAELLSDAGYHTSGVIAAQHLATSSGLRQGFDRWGAFRQQLYAESVVDFAFDRIERATEPFFLFLHFFDVHVPHVPPLPYAEGWVPASAPGWQKVEDWVAHRPTGLRLFQRNRRNLAGHPDLYLDEVAYLDRELGRLFAYLEAHGHLDDTWVVVVGDHGETLGERGHSFDHAGLATETTHVPLLVHRPRQERGRRIAGMVQHLDLFPTLLAAAGVVAPASDGRDLATLAAEGPRPAVFAQAPNDRGEMVRTRRWLYFVDRDLRGREIPHLYDLAGGEQLRGQAAAEHPEARRLDALLDRWSADRREGETGRRRKLSPEEEDELRSLGYL